MTGFTAATVGNVDVTLTDSNGAVSVLNAAASTSDDNQPNGDNLNGSGQTTAVFTSATAGQVTGHATVTLVVGGQTLVRQTDGLAGNSGDAIKTFVDAKISITPNATNEVGQPHTFTVTVLQDDGLTAAARRRRRNRLYRRDGGQRGCHAHGQQRRRVGIERGG